MSIRLGLLAYSTNSGLGIQTQDLAKHLKPSKIMCVDLSQLNKAKQYPERFPNAQFIKGYPQEHEIDSFLHGLDCVIVAETPLNYYLFSKARELGIKTVQIPNWEFFDYFRYPNHPKPDMIISPSLWHSEELRTFCWAYGIDYLYLHQPVDRQVFKRRSISNTNFLHNAGRSAAHDRNGTETVIDASKYIKTAARLFIHFQGEQGLGHQATNTIEQYRTRLQERGDPHKVTIIQSEHKDCKDIYESMDVLLMPRRYGGNCLPVGEALSLGMPVIMTDLSPNNEFLPKEWLIPATKIGEFSPRTTVDIYGSDPRALAAKIDEFYNLSLEDMQSASDKADKLAQNISWDVAAPHYRHVLETLCNQS